MLMLLRLRTSPIYSRPEEDGGNNVGEGANPVDRPASGAMAVIASFLDSLLERIYYIAILCYLTCNELD